MALRKASKTYFEFSIVLRVALCYNILAQMLYCNKEVDYMKHSDIIKSIRTKLNLSQADLAEKLGVSFATVNRCYFACKDF